MATPKIIADFETQLSTAISVSDTSFSLSSATDDDGVALPAGKYYFTVDNGTSNKEYLVGTLSGTSVTAVSTVSRQGTETSGAAKAHRVGSPIIITDFLTYKNYMDEIALVSAPDADTNTKGVLEAATLAEVRARTASGGSGANLAVTPDVMNDLPSEDEKAALAGTSGSPSTSNKFVTADDVATDGTTDKIVRLSGTDLPSEITQSVKLLSVSAATTDLAPSDTTEGTVLSYSVPASMLGTTNAIRLRVVTSNFQDISGSGTATLRLKYGSTTIASVVLTPSSGTNTLKGEIEAMLIANSSTSAQTGYLNVDLLEDELTAAVIGSGTSTYTRGLSVGTASEDSTGALTVSITIQFSGGNASHNLSPAIRTVELLS